MARLEDVDIFYPGVWNGLSFSNPGMVASVNNSNYCLPFTHPQLSLDHGEVAEDIIQRASFGAVARFYLKVKHGVNHIYCTFEHVRTELADIIKHHYPRRSLELIPFYEHPITHELFRDVIVGVSFLGAKMHPAVKAMFPDFIVEYAQPPAGAISIMLPFNDQAGTPGELMETTMAKRKTVKQVFEDPPEITPETSELSLFLSARRAELGLTEAEVAERMNADGQPPVISEELVTNSETGFVMPAAALLGRFETALELEPNTLRGLLTMPSVPPADDAADDAADVPAPAFSADAMRQVVLDVLREFQLETLGMYLRQLREAAGLSVEDLAQALEVASENVAAIEEASIPEDSLLEKYAQLFEVSLDDLKARRDAMKTAQIPAETPAEGEAAPEDEMQAFAMQAIAPIKAEVDRLKQERDQAKRDKEAQDIEHFLENLSVQFGAAQILTNDRVKTLLLRADGIKPVRFSAAATPQTTRQALMDVLQEIAKFGAEHATIITDQLIQPGQTPPPEPEEEELNEVGKIQKFMAEKGIKTFQQGVRKYYLEQSK